MDPSMAFLSGCPSIPRPADLGKIVQGWPETLRARWEATAGALEELGVSAREANLDAYRAVCAESGRDEADGDLPFDAEWFDRASALADYPPIPAVGSARLAIPSTDAAPSLFDRSRSD